MRVPHPRLVSLSAELAGAQTPHRSETLCGFTDFAGPERVRFYGPDPQGFLSTDLYGEKSSCPLVPALPGP